MTLQTHTPIRRCGRPYSSYEAAARSKRALAGTAVPVPCPVRCGSWHLENVQPADDTGFPRAVKLAVRVRAGKGDADQARCEATGVWLGPDGGEVQHRVARLAGGRGVKAPPWFHTAANAALLSREAHRLAEARDEHMRAAGFWLTSKQDATAEPIMLHDPNDGGGVAVWLDEFGGYSLLAPGGI